MVPPSKKKASAKARAVTRKKVAKKTGKASKATTTRKSRTTGKGSAAGVSAKRKSTTKKTSTRSVKPAARTSSASKGTTRKTAARKSTASGKGAAGTRNVAAEIEARLKASEAQPAEEEEVPTEVLWTLYRKEASKRGTKDPRDLEKLRNELMERHYPLVRYIAERLLQTLPKSIELDDLVSAGLFGLMDAIRGFDASRGIKFKTYCSTRIRGAILDQLRSQDWVPRLVRLKASRIERALQRLTAEYGREPTHAELARVLEMDHADLVKEIQESRAKTMFSLSEKWEDDDGAVEKVEVVEDRTAIDPVHEMNRRDLMTFITRALTHKERFIIEQYYQYGHTMREIGEMLALTESRVCQIHSNVMSRLKGLLGQRHESLLS
jgi:RNA polymerase sigma factor for flagellar operon FliA